MGAQIVGRDLGIIQVRGNGLAQWRWRWKEDRFEVYFEEQTGQINRDT